MTQRNPSGKRSLSAAILRLLRFRSKPAYRILIRDVREVSHSTFAKGIGSILLVAAVNFGAVIAAESSPITYTFTGSASGSMGPTAFSNAPFTLTLAGDTWNIRQGIYSEVFIPAQGTIAIDGIGQTAINEPLGLMSLCGGGAGVLAVYRGTVAHRDFWAFNVFGIPGGACYLRQDSAFRNLVPTVGKASNIATTFGPLSITSLSPLDYSAPNDARPTGAVLHVNSNPYGALTVVGAKFDGSTISELQNDVVIQLGSVAPSNPTAFASFTYDQLDIGAGSTLTFRSGSAEQKIQLAGLNNADPSSIAGRLVFDGANGAPPAKLKFYSVLGIEVFANGSIVSQGSMEFETPTWFGRQVNNGAIVSNEYLSVKGATVTGGGSYISDNFTVLAYGNANNPKNGPHYLSNGLQLSPATGTTVALTIGHYGSAPQAINLKVHGDTSIWMPSRWPDSANLLQNNNATVSLGNFTVAGTPAPPYGGGSLIVQTTGSMKLFGYEPEPAINDFIFPGGIALIAGGVLDLNGVLINQGWTTSGQPFQGVYLESPHIFSSRGNIQVAGNDLNWLNFSTFPKTPVRVWTFVKQADGSSRYAPADSTAPHLNTYSTLVEAAANGQCWICLVNSQPVNVYGP